MSNIKDDDGDDDEDFKRQLELEAAEAAAAAKEQNIPSTSTSSNPYLYTDASGCQYEWDHNRRAWIPKIDDDFMARYQAAYGFNQETNGDVENSAESAPKEKTSDNNQDQKDAHPSSSHVKVSNEETNNNNKEEGEENDVQHKGRGKRKQEASEAEKAEWFEVDDDHNKNVYVSNLPLDTTNDEFIELMSKYGLIMKDMTTGEHKIKMYKDGEGRFKGDALCTYIKVESVELAIQLLDESRFKNNVIRVERAKFTLKGEYDASKKKPKRGNKEKKKMQKKLDKLFDWRPDKLPGERSKAEKCIIITNMFDISEFTRDPKLILEYRTDLREECSEKCGEVRKVEIYDNNPAGVAAVFFNDFDSADKCVQLMNGRFFAGRKLQAFHWDGKTKFKINETEEEAEKRIAEWDNFLHSSS